MKDGALIVTASRPAHHRQSYEVYVLTYEWRFPRNAADSKRLPGTFSALVMPGIEPGGTGTTALFFLGVKGRPRSTGRTGLSLKPMGQ